MAGVKFVRGAWWPFKEGLMEGGAGPGGAGSQTFLLKLPTYRTWAFGMNGTEATSRLGEGRNWFRARGATRASWQESRARGRWHLTCHSLCTTLRRS